MLFTKVYQQHLHLEKLLAKMCEELPFLEKLLTNVCMLFTKVYQQHLHLKKLLAKICEELPFLEKLLVILRNELHSVVPLGLTERLHHINPAIKHPA